MRHRRAVTMSFICKGVLKQKALQCYGSLTGKRGVTSTACEVRALGESRASAANSAVGEQR